VRAFGIDPGSHRTGWGVLESNGNQFVAIAAGVIQMPEQAPLHERVEPIFVELSKLLEEHRPELVCVESVFHQRNARSALVLGHARGVALLAARRSGSPIQELTPAEVKKAVTGSGRAEKSQVQSMVKVLLGLAERLPYDASDALAVALAGLQRARSPISQLIETQKKSRRALPAAFRRARPSRTEPTP
jgi:crossover junction endodeoxyribonuclease RuvC